MNLLLTGKNGQLGFELQRALASVGRVQAVGRDECDLADAQAIRELVRQSHPAVIVNAAAYTAVDRAETEKTQAHAVNAEAPAILAAEAARCGALLVHYSTDYVFAGEGCGFHRETDATAPLNTYGASKRAGEQAIQASGAPALIFRTSWVVSVRGQNFIKTMLRLAREKTALNVVSDQFGAPTSAALLADISAHAIRLTRTRPEPQAGCEIYHLAAAGVTNWHEIACHVIAQARQAGLPVSVAPNAIAPIATTDWPTPARRPANSRLDTQKIRKDFGVHLPAWQNGVDHILEQILPNNCT